MDPSREVPKPLVDWPYIIGLVLIPVVVVLVLFGIRQFQELTRFDPAYFTETYRNRYDSPGTVAIDLERALRDADERLMADLLATRTGPAPMTPQPSLIFVFLLDRQGEYFHYLYFRSSDYHRVIQYVKQHNGRYIASEADLYFYMDSGQWTGVAGPIAATWWILVAVYTAATYVYRRMGRARSRMFGR